MSDGNEILSPLKRALIEIRGMRARIDAMEHARTEPIALVGIGCRFPGGVDSPEALWQLLRDGTDAITEVPPDRWDINAYFDADLAAPGKMTTRFGGFVRDIDHFDPGFFSIARREAEQMDPQQRLLLEVAWEALERACIVPDSLAGSDTGVFIGIANSDYFRMLASDLDQIDVYLGTGNATSVAAGRISYLLGLHGPSMSLDTACSSSLVAVHLACQSLRARECSLALAGGVNLILSPDININFSKAQMLSPDGRSKFGDTSADGYVRGEGCGVVVLKRLSDAVAAGDPIVAVIRGSAINQDGRSSGLTAPHGPAQEAVLRAALANAGLAPADIGYIEAHGTGTALGDPIELQALGAVFGPAHRASLPLPVGSLKTNLGHTEAAAGIAGLIKTALMLQHGAIPASLHFTTPSALVSWKELALEVPTALRPWESADHLRRAGVSSFGFSGTNAHVLLEQAPEPIVTEATSTTLRPLQLLPLSAKTQTALRDLAARYIATLTENPEVNITDVCFTAATGRAHYAQRLVVRGADDAAMRAGLSAYLDGAASPHITTGDASNSQPEVVFLFTGHGSHYAGMGKSLYASEPVFQAALNACAMLLQPHLDKPLQDILFSERASDNTHPLDRMDYAQPALFALQFALAEQWRAWGVQPAAVAGHSAGEYVAAVVAGVLSLEDGLRLIVTRGKLMQQLPRDGAMVAIFADETTVASAIKPYANKVSIAAINGPATTVISGQRAAVDAVLNDLALADDDFRRLDISVAAHSPLVEPILDEFERAVDGVTLSPPQITLISSMTGQPISDAITQPNYWRRHLRQPVRFADVFATLRDSGYNTFVEMGPHPTLIGLGQRCWPDDSATWMPSLRKDTNDSEQMQAGLAALYVHGVAVNWRGVMGPESHRKVALPTYPWQHERYWSPVATAAAAGSIITNKIDAGAIWTAASNAAQAQAEQGPLDLTPTSYAARWEALNRLADAYITQAICELGLFQQAGERFSPANIASLGIASTYAQLVERWLGHLVEAGALRQDTDGSFVADVALHVPHSEIQALERDAATQFVDSAPLLAYVRRCGERLATVLTGAESALATLFPDGSYETVDFIYNRWAVARFFNGIARAATVAAAHAKPGQPFRMLEIGAGTGGTAAALLPALPADRTTYVFTDVSDFFRARAAERFAAYKFVRYGLLNIEQSPQEQGYAAHSFDVVVAANVLHATRDLNATLKHALDLLTPGGMLVLYETTNHPRWLDITTGLIEGWQRFDDQWRDDHPLLNAPRWEQALRANGFNEVLALPGVQESTAIFGQHIILARAPLGTHAPQAVRDVTSPGMAEFAVQVISGEPEPILDALAQALPDERHDVLVDFVRRAVARVLRSGDPQRLGREQRLLDLGFDSLMAVELRNVLRQGLVLEQKLPATLVFDHPTISAIASFLERMTAPAEPVIAKPINEVQTSAPSARAAEIADMTDEQVEALLMKRLEGI